MFHPALSLAFSFAAFAPLALQESSPAAASSELHVAASEKLSDVVRDLVDVMNASITCDEGTSDLLNESDTGLVSDADVPKERFQTFAEGLLALHGLALNAARIDTPSVYSIQSAAKEGARTPVGPTLEESELADHPALRIDVTARFDTLGGSTLSALLRPALTAGTLEVQARGNDVHLIGPAALAGDLVTVLRSIDREGELGPIDTNPRDLLSRVNAPLELAELTTLFDVVRAYDAITGLHVALSDAARERLVETHITNTDRAVEPEEVHTYVSGLLYGAGLSTSVLSRTSPRILAVYTEDALGRLRALPLRVDTPEELELFPSLQVMMPLQVANADTRRFPVELRTLAPSPSTTFLFSSGTRRVVLGGRAADLVPYWTAIVAIDNQ